MVTIVQTVRVTGTSTTHVSEAGDVRETEGDGVKLRVTELLAENEDVRELEGVTDAVSEMDADMDVDIVGDGD